MSTQASVSTRSTASRVLSTGSTPSVPISASSVPVMKNVKDLEAALDDAEKALDLYLHSKVKEARAFSASKQNSSFYHAAVHSLVKASEALMSMKKDEILKAQSIVFKSTDICDRERTKSSPTARNVNISSLNDIQMHAELCHAECNLAKALLNILVDDTGLVGLTKAAVAIKRVQAGYSLCKKMLQHGKFGSQKSKDNFAVGVNLGLGAVHLFIGSAPERMVKLLDIQSSHFSAETGRSLLQKGFDTKGTARTNICGIIVLVYYMYIQFIWGISPVPFAAFEPVLDHFVKNYPNGSVTLFLKGKRDQLKGDFENSNKSFKESIKVISDVPGFQDASNWELMYNCLLTGDYKQGIHYADGLLKRCSWSKCSFAYMKAILMIGDNQPVEAVRGVMRTVPQLKKAYAGQKYLPTEQFFEHKSNRYLAQGGKLTLPVEEQIYLWRGFLLLKDDKERLEQIEKNVEEAEKVIKDNPKINNDDNISIINIIRAATARAKGDDQGAVVHFEKAAKCRVNQEQWVVPYATFELALLDLKNGHVANAMKLIKRALGHKQKYLLEVRLQFRADAAMRIVNDAVGKK